jgi:hypothetical protein
MSAPRWGLPATSRRAAWWQSAGSDDGSAIVEFCYLGILMLVPLVYVMLAVLRVQAGAYAVTGAAQEAGRVLADLPSGQDPQAAAYTAARVAAADQHIDLAPGDVELACSPDASCRVVPGQRIDVTVRVTVGLPFLPQVFDDTDARGVPVEAHHVEEIGRFHGGGRP